MTEQEKQAIKLMEVIQSASDDLDKYHSLTDGEHTWNPWPYFPELRDSMADAICSLDKALQKIRRTRPNPEGVSMGPNWVRRISINDPRLNWDVRPPLVTINGLEYYLLRQYVANPSLQIIQEGSKTLTPVMDMGRVLNPEILDFIFQSMSLAGRGLNEKFFQMTIFSSLKDTNSAISDYIEDRKRGDFRGFWRRKEGAQIGTIQKEVLPEEVHFPYLTKFLQTPKFNLIDGLWHPAEDGEYEDVFCCMEMVPFACSIRFKSLLPA
jgi:hypothetical protein